MSDNIIGMSPGDLAKFRERVDNRAKPVLCGDIDLRGVLFYNMDLTNVGFWGCDLSSTIFCECKMDGRAFNRANLLGTVFVNTCVEYINEMRENIEKCGRIYYKMFNEYQYGYIGQYEVVVPPTEIEGEFVGYKILKDAQGKYLIAKLVIPADARRVVFKGEKCRASKVYVKEIKQLNGDDKIGECSSVGYSPIHSTIVEYKVGEMTEADGFDESCKECTNGIHFFLTQEEAIEFWLYYC